MPKFIASLPTGLEESLILLPSNSERFPYIWRDKLSPLCRFYSPIANPFGKEWLIMPSENSGKSDESKYALRMDFKLFSPEQALAEGMQRFGFSREQYKARFPSFSLIAWGASFPATRDENDNPIIWINYGFLPREK